MVVGFTGTGEGMSPGQMAEFCWFLTEMNKYQPITEFHHGDCIGADAQAHDLVQRLLPRVDIILHPCTLTDKRAYCKGAKFVAAPLAPLDRNGVIVENADLLIAAPKSNFEVLRSGTWATIRRMRIKIKQFPECELRILPR